MRAGFDSRMGTGAVCRDASLRLAATIVVLFVWPLPAVAQDTGELWEVTTKMDMPGMPVALPAQTQRVCLPKTRKDDDLVPKREGCRVSDVKRAGSKVTFNIACTGTDPMAGTGEITSAPTSYDGRMRLKGKMGDDTMEMTHTFAGTRVGDCK
jgi:Protein of unknown function (DUF3617)